MYPYITYTIGITGCPLQKKKKKKEEAKEEKEEEVEATLQDGYEVDARPASQPCPVHTLMEIAEARIRFAEEALAEIDAFRFRFTEEALAESRPLF